MDKIIVIMSGGGQGRVVLDALLALGRTVTGVLDDGHDVGGYASGVPVLGLPARWRNHAVPDIEFAVAMAHPDMRRALAEEILAAGVPISSAVHPAATVSPSAVLGRGVFVLAGAVVGPDARVGDFTILNMNCSVDHDCVLGTAVQLGPGVTLAAGVTCDDGASIGAGATVLPGMRVGRRVIVGGGAVVTTMVPDGVVVTGNPARPLG